MRVFRSRGISPRGLVLPYADFRLFCDTGSTVFNEEKIIPVIKKAEDFLKREITTIPLSAFRSYQEKGVIGPYSGPWCDRMDAALHLAIAESYEGKGRFTEKLCDYVWAILEEATWMIPEHTGHAPYGVTKVPAVVGDKYIHGLELGSVYLAATVAVVYHYAKDAMASISPIICERIEYAIHERLIWPYLNCDFTWEGDRGNKVNNWCPWNISNILLATALVERNTAVRERVVEKALHHLDNFISFYKPDGGCDEGPTYWGAAAGSLFDCLETVYDMTGGGIDVYDDPLIRAMGEYFAKFCIKGNRFVNFADSGATCSADGAMLKRYGEKCGSRLLAEFGHRMPSGGLFFKHPYRSLRSLITPPLEKPEVELAAESVYLPDLKVMIERESTDPSRGFLLAAKGGHNNESHNHNDVGSVIVYYDGEPLLIDAGVGAYTKQTFSPRRYELWFMQSNYHNVAMFDGIGQRAGAAYSARDEVYNPDARSLTLELAGAYPKEACVESYIRRSSLGRGEVEVKDSIRLSEEKEIDLIFLTHREPRVTATGTVELCGGHLLEYFGEGFTAEVEEFDPVGMNTVRMWGTEKMYRIHIKRRAIAADVTVKVR